MAKNEEGLKEIFTVKLTRDVFNFPSEGDLSFIRNKFNVADNVPVAVFNQAGQWISTHESA